MVDNQPSNPKLEAMKEIEDPEINKPAKLFLEESFKEYVKEKYLVQNAEVLQNPTIMQMILALEWYDIPRTSYSDLVEYHPYLTAGDHDKLFYINTQHRIENTVSFALFSLISNNYLRKRGGWLQKRYVRAPLAMGIGGIFTYVFNYFILRPIYLHDIEELGLDRYFQLDLNADMMKQDLENLGIKIEAKHFNLEQTEERLNQQYNKSEDKNTK